MKNSYEVNRAFELWEMLISFENFLYEHYNEFDEIDMDETYEED